MKSISVYVCVCVQVCVFCGIIEACDGGTIVKEEGNSEEGDRVRARDFIENETDAESKRETHNVGSGGHVEYEGEASRTGVIE